MELSEKERLFLSNQLKILEVLYPDDASYYLNHRTAVERGYALHYSWLAEHLYPEMSESECKEVLDILDMYRAITSGIEKLDPADELREHMYAKFSGFDGNNESAQMGYVQYFVTQLGRYEEIESSTGGYFNSHAPMLPTYTAMVNRWQGMGTPFPPTRDQLIGIFEAEHAE